MKSFTITSRILGAVGTALVATLLLVPAAAAGQGNGHGKHGNQGKHGHQSKHERHVKVERHVVHERHAAPRHHDERRHGHRPAIRPYRYGHDYRVVSAPRARFTIPVRLGVNVGRYDSYYQGSVWYGPHRHQHRVYDFPVYHDGYWVARPYFYCGDHRFDGFHASWRGPNVSIDLRF